MNSINDLKEIVNVYNSLFQDKPMKYDQLKRWALHQLLKIIFWGLFLYITTLFIDISIKL